MAEKMMEKKIPSALPLYISAGVFLLAAIVFPLYQFWGLLLAGALAGGAYLVAKKNIAPRTVMVPVPRTIYNTGEQTLNETLTDAENELTQLAALNERISNTALSARITRMEKAGRSILKEVQDHPEKGRKISKFAAYYLPTALKVLTDYVNLSASGATGQNAKSVLEQVDQNAETIAKAFEAQLDALFAGDALDLSADVTVLDAMAKADGLATGTSVKTSSAQDGPTLTL